MSLLGRLFGQKAGKDSTLNKDAFRVRHAELDALIPDDIPTVRESARPSPAIKWYQLGHIIRATPGIPADKATYEKIEWALHAIGTAIEEQMSGGTPPDLLEFPKKPFEDILRLQPFLLQSQTDYENNAPQDHPNVIPLYPEYEYAPKAVMLRDEIRFIADTRPYPEIARTIMTFSKAMTDFAGRHNLWPGQTGPSHQQSPFASFEPL